MSIITNTKKWIELEAGRNSRNRLAVFLDMAYNYVRYGVFPQEYYHYGFFKKNHEDKCTYFTTKLYNKRRAELSDPSYENVIFQDKFIFAKVFSELYGRKCLLLTPHTEKSVVLDFLTETDKVVYKPLEACEGQGIKSFTKSSYATIDDMCNDIYKMLGKARALLDEWIIQSEDMRKFYPKGVNCIRIYTFLYEGHFEFIDAKVSFGTNSDIVNATLDGNLFAIVDVKTGVITSDLTDYTLVVHEKHPVTGFKARGTKLPRWEECLGIAKRAAYLVPNVVYVGWDIALTDEGPVLIEGNHCGGCGGNQFCTLRKESTGTREKWDVKSRL